MKLINVSGYMGSGRSAVTDILREFQGYSVPSSDDEFELLSHRDGLNSLYSIFESKSNVSFSEAINEFIRLTDYLGNDLTGFKKYYQWGINYNNRYNDFHSNTKDFIKSICLASWVSNHPNGQIKQGYIDSFISKLRSKITNTAPWPENTFYLMNNDGFEDKFINYLEAILKPKNESKVIINNGFEVNSCHKYLKLFNDPYSINVERDIRDIYLSMRMAKKSRYSEHYIKICGAFDVKLFALYQKNLHHNNDIQEERILNVKFEDLISDYELSIDRILGFLNENISIHVNKMKCFDPRKSEGNIRLWEKLELSEELLSDVKYLEKVTPDLCYL